MNIIRKLILLITALIIALWCFFPPTYYTRTPSGLRGYRRVDVERLWGGVVGIAMVGGVFYFILGERKHNKKYNRERTNILGPIETAIRKRFTHSERLYTPAKKRPFEIVVKQDVPNDELFLLLGGKRTPTSIRWECLEGIPDFLKGKDWVRIGGVFDTRGDPTTLDGYLKKCIKRATAGWIAVALEEAGIVEIDRRRPLRVRLKTDANKILR